MLFMTPTKTIKGMGRTFLTNVLLLILAIITATNVCRFHIIVAICFAIILGLLILISWLSNHEINRSLEEAAASQRALRRERDSLEIRVKQRTQELEKSQLLRTMELQHFAEFGRLSATLVHEVANPLTAASIHLDLVHNSQDSLLVKKARDNLLQLERYIAAARKQLKIQSISQDFSIREELQHVRQIMTPLARQAYVQLVIKQRGDQLVHGDPIKFNHVITTIVVNALDAYAATSKPPGQKRIVIQVTDHDDWLEINITDWGIGIPSESLPNIFRPFYTSKMNHKRGIGIGLSTVKHIVENDFYGSITATSSPQEGTCFSIRLKTVRQAAPKRKQ